MRIFFYLIILCSTLQLKAMKNPFYQGLYHAELDLGEVMLPFNLEIYGGINTFRALQMTIINGDEFIKIDDIKQLNDGMIVARLPIFDSVLRFRIENERLVGHWVNYAKSDDYKLAFTATPNEKRRFLDETVIPIMDLSGRWEVTFSPDSDDTYPAVGEFRQSGNYVSATFITETGDYRYLQGVINGNVLKMSAFDGAHAFLFTAEVDHNKTLRGKFYSGSHWEEPWEAIENEKAILTDPDKLTYLKDGFTTVDFSYANESEKMISLSDEKFNNKVVIIQVLGSWCPNCLDETRLYTRLYNKYCDEGLEIVGLAFEATEDKDKAWTTLKRYKQQLGIDYELLYAGKASKRVASESLPMLNKIISFPTSIIIDRAGIVQKVHTGFYGPATSSYDSYAEDFEKMIVGLLSE